MITMIPSQSPNQYQQGQIDRKFGMFVHYGINTFLNQEWSDGTAAPSTYAPTGLDCEQWARTAYEAGMNYLLVITKHHDGFCMWDTQTTRYGVRYAGNQADVVRQAAKACKKYGIQLALYYSLWDRNCPFYQDDEAYTAYMLRQLEELMDGRYGEVVELWLDGGWDKPCARWGLDKIYDLVKRLQHGCQMGVNHCIGNHEWKGGFASEKYHPDQYEQHDPIALFPSDFRLLDPYMLKDEDPKIYSYHGELYYMPFEATFCSWEGMCWFYSDGYEEKFPLHTPEELARCYRQLIGQQNLLVVNLPANKSGRLVQSDIDNLMKTADLLSIRRTV